MRNSRGTVTCEELRSMCFQDRFSLIVPKGMEDLAEEMLEPLVRSSRVTGILTQHYGEGVFYHATQEPYVERILSNGLRVVPPDSRAAESLSFGGGVIYTFDDVHKLRKPDGTYPPIIEISYMGPWLKSLYEEDKPEEVFGACMLYPSGVQSLRLWDSLDEPLGSEPQKSSRTSAFE